MAGQARVGISGWRYPPWRGVFYPRGLAQRRELAYASQRLDTIELNGSFYSLQRPSSYRAWYAETPPDFVFAVKGSRFITHMKRLADAETGLANFLASGVLALGEKLGPILWQLPPTFAFHADTLAAFLAILPRTTGAAARLAARHDGRLAHGAVTEAAVDAPLRHVLEVRHDSFADPAFTDLARRHGICVAVADTAGRWPMLNEATADFGYVRLHGDTELYASGYSGAALDEWADVVLAWRRAGDVFVYFDNDIKVHAPFDAMALAERLRDTPT